ncbi:gag-pol polyprotein [Trifolium pratense]|uniref:Gag-pol polyprotein n=1 Tax=Trifolium pratense TaxID=57577 RepID=A0A2K3MM88_TRIPR|nr:gag-pol polyprotein [Trifolium pratense]
MNLPKNSVEGYVDFSKKFMHQFAGSRHVKVTSTSLFSIRQNHNESLRNYLARFCEATIKVSNPNQEMFVAAFHNGLRAGHFNESLAQKPALSMQEINKRAECYIKGEESNAEKRQRDAKERDPASRSGRNQDQQRPKYGNQHEGSWQRRPGNPYFQRRDFKSYPDMKGYTPLNTSPVHVLKEILTTGLASLPPKWGGNAQLGQNENAWCAYHRCKGHATEKCFRLRDLIEELIKSGHLRKFIEDAAEGRVVVPKKPRQQVQDSSERREEPPKERVSVNTIAGGFAGGGESSSARKRYVRQALSETFFVGKSSSNPLPDLAFTAKDGLEVAPHDDDPLVIQVQILNCDVKRVLIDSGSSADILYWEAFKAMQLAEEQLQPYSGTLVGFSGEQVDVMGYATLLTTFGTGDSAKTVKVRYLVVKTPFTSYNIIIGRPAFNALGAVMSTLYLAIKYPLDNGGVGTVRGDQLLAKRCYESSLKIRHRNSSSSSNPNKRQTPPQGGINMVESAEMDPREELHNRRVSPIEELEQIQIGGQPHQTTNLGTALSAQERERIIKILKDNADLFAWTPSDMPGIDESVITHKLSISPDIKPIAQRKRKVGEERRAAIAEEVAKLKEAGFIEEIKYPSWLANVVMVKKANGKWRMCVDFTDLNKACPKDPYPLPNIDRLIDGASGCRMLSFMDAYSGYNQIKMSPVDAPHTAFMSNTCNYFYNVMPFGLKNAGATYQRLMDRVFSEQIGKNLEVYIDDMVV